MLTMWYNIVMNTVTELNDRIDSLSMALREKSAEIDTYNNSETTPLGDYDEMEDAFDAIQEELANLHIQLGVAYRLEELDENCDCDHSLILSTVYN